MTPTALLLLRLGPLFLGHLAAFHCLRAITVRGEYGDCRRRADPKIRVLIKLLSAKIQSGILNANLLPFYSFVADVVLSELRSHVLPHFPGLGQKTSPFCMCAILNAYYSERML
jgi:hypothetical protein